MRLCKKLRSVVCRLKASSFGKNKIKNPYKLNLTFDRKKYIIIRLRRKAYSLQAVINFGHRKSKLRSGATKNHFQLIFSNNLIIYIEAWLSLVERCVRDAEAVGSSPVASTKTKGAVKKQSKNSEVHC